MKKNIKGCILLGVMLAVFNYTDVQAALNEANANEQEWEVLKIVNEERTKEGSEGLSTFKKMQSAAGIRAQELVELFSHTRPDGTSCFSVLEDQNIRYYSAGENIAAGQQNPQHVMNSWMNSPGHKSNILGAYSHIGVGYTTGGCYGKNWVQLFIGGCNTQKIEVGGISNAGYAQGSKISDMDLYLIVTCDMHGESYMPLSDNMCKGYKASDSGSQTVSVTYRNVQTNFKVNIKSDGTTESQELKKPSKVSSFALKKISTSKVKLTWKKLNADGYEVYMKTGSGKYKKVKTINKGSTVSYTVKKLKKNIKYSFKVRAYNKSESEKKYGKFSTVKSIKL